VKPFLDDPKEIRSARYGLVEGAATSRAHLSA